MDYIHSAQMRRQHQYVDIMYVQHVINKSRRTQIECQHTDIFQIVLQKEMNLGIPKEKHRQIMEMLWKN